MASFIAFQWLISNDLAEHLSQPEHLNGFLAFHICIRKVSTVSNHEKHSSNILLVYHMLWCHLLVSYQDASKAINRNCINIQMGFLHSNGFA